MCELLKDYQMLNCWIQTCLFPREMLMHLKDNFKKIY